jgi:hypothetical protein
MIKGIGERNFEVGWPSAHMEFRFEADEPHQAAAAEPIPTGIDHDPVEPWIESITVAQAAAVPPRALNGVANCILGL